GGLNLAIATYSYTNESPGVRGKWFGGLGAIVGLFSVCPTCAGFFLLTMLGLAGSHIRANACLSSGRVSRRRTSVASAHPNNYRSEGPSESGDLMQFTSRRTYGPPITFQIRRLSGLGH